VNARSTFVSHIEPAKLMEPGQRPLDDPARPAEATAVVGAALGQLRFDTPATKRVAVRLRIIPAVALHQVRLAPRAARAAAKRGNAVDEWQQLRDVVAVGPSQPRRKRNPLRVSEKVMFRPRLTAIGRVRSSFFPPRSARMEELSTRARAKSSWPRWRKSASRTAWRRRQTPARCQRTKRRQHVLPDPQPISFGSICHGSPLRKTNRIPVSAARSGTRGRPILLNRRRGGFGNRGSMRLHKASSISRWARCDRLAAGHATVPRWPEKYKRHVNYF
jgi:hypothetical protein